MTEQAAVDNNPTDPPPTPQLSPVFAGGDPIEEENQGNVEDLHEGIAPNTDVPPPATDPAPEPAPAQPEGEAASPDANAAAPVPAPENTGEAGEPVQNRGEPEPAAAAAEPPEEAPSPEPLAGEAPAPAAQPEDQTQVPSFRLAQEAARRRAAEARAQSLEQQLRQQQQQGQQVPPQVPGQAPAPVAPQNNQQAPAPNQADPAPQPAAFDLGDDPKQMFDKVLDGDLDKATELFSDMMKQAVAQNAQQVPANQVTQESLDQMVTNRVHEMRARDAEMEVIEALEKAHPQLDPKNKEAYDGAMVDEIVALKSTYINMQFAPADAVQRAAAMVLQANGVADLWGEEKSPNAPATPSAAPDPKSISRNVAAQNAQPPELPQGAAPQAAPEVDVMKLSEEDFAALPESTVARLRGDYG